MSLEALHTQCGDSVLSHSTRLFNIVIHSPLTQKTSIKGCPLVFTLFIHGLSPLRSRLFFRPSGHIQEISFISVHGAVVIKFQYTAYTLGCQCFMSDIIRARQFTAFPYFDFISLSVIYLCYLCCHTMYNYFMYLLS